MPKKSAKASPLDATQVAKEIAAALLHPHGEQQCHRLQLMQMQENGEERNMGGWSHPALVRRITTILREKGMAGCVIACLLLTSCGGSTPYPGKVTKVAHTPGGGSIYLIDYDGRQYLATYRGGIVEITPPPVNSPE